MRPYNKTNCEKRLWWLYIGHLLRYHYRSRKIITTDLIKLIMNTDTLEKITGRSLTVVCMSHPIYSGNGKNLQILRQGPIC